MAHFSTRLNLAKCLIVGIFLSEEKAIEVERIHINFINYLFKILLETHYLWQSSNQVCQR